MMDNPVEEITDIVHTLCQAPPKKQEDAINKYFTMDAEFTHPFCRTGSFNGSRASILSIFRWYKILSPRIDLSVNSIGESFVSLHRSKIRSLEDYSLARISANPVESDVNEMGIHPPVVNLTPMRAEAIHFNKFVRM